MTFSTTQKMDEILKKSILAGWFQKFAELLNDAERICPAGNSPAGALRSAFTVITVSSAPHTNQTTGEASW